MDISLRDFGLRKRRARGQFAMQAVNFSVSETQVRSAVNSNYQATLQAIEFRQFDAVLYPESKRTSGSARKCGATPRRRQNSLVSGRFSGTSRAKSSSWRHWLGAANRAMCVSLERSGSPPQRRTTHGL